MPAFDVDLSGKSALLTGAGVGCGRAIAVALASSGASVAVSDLNIERADAVAEAIKSAGGEAIASQADISNRFQVANMIEQTRDAYGGIDILVNGTGVNHVQPLLAVDEWDWRRQLELNVTGAFFCMQLAGRVMAEEGGGHIINITSVEPERGSPRAGIGFATGNGAIAAMTRQAARELGPLGIRVNAIAASAELEQAQLGAAGGPSEIASVALFLCSDAAGFIAGQVIVVDGRASLLG